MKHAIMIDFGSTFTKIVIADLTTGKLVLSDKFPSTVHTDARICMNQCFDVARKVLSKDEFANALKLSSSSAAGGLRMAVSGLTKSLSVTAGRQAVFGAGAKVLGTYHGLLDDEKISEIESLPLEIMFLCGGYENGNCTSVLHNAQKLADSQLRVPVVYSGNRQIAKKIRKLFRAAGKECFVIDNILPEIGVINVAPSQEIIRDLFMKRITNMKGLSGVKDALGEILMPTPAAVLRAGTLLSTGTDTQAGLGDMMMVDVGGATTDVYSFNVNTAADGAIISGAPEPFAKRMVEGDMGMRESSFGLLKEIDCKDLAERAGVSEKEFRKALWLRTEDTDYIPQNEIEIRIDQVIAAAAIYISSRRHAGILEYSYSGNCEMLQRGKNLTDIKKIIGTGGPVINSRDPASLLREVCLKDSDRNILLPRDLDTFIDKDYVFFAAGLLSYYDKEAAFSLMTGSISHF